MDDLLIKINNFYYSWDKFERDMGKEGGLVIDWNYSRKSLTYDNNFQNRESALLELEEIQDRLKNADSKNFVNKEYLKLKLLGSKTYIEALMGQKTSFSDYLQKTMGFIPTKISDEEISQNKEKLIKSLEGLGLQWDSKDQYKLHEWIDFRPRELFGASLREHAKNFVSKISELLEFNFEPNYVVQDVAEDAYWSNWIDGSYDSPIRLRINLHPRASLRKGLDLALASHEIAGHAMHVLNLDQSQLENKLDSPVMNLTVHACESFQMEGLAQSVLYLMVEEDQISKECRLSENLYFYHTALIQNAHLEIENGLAIEEAKNKVKTQAPFLDELIINSDLRDRLNNPLFRSYMYVYYPSYKMFSEIFQKDRASQINFFKKMYAELWTPAQIKKEIDSYV